MLLISWISIYCLELVVMPQGITRSRDTYDDERDEHHYRCRKTKGDVAAKEERYADDGHEDGWQDGDVIERLVCSEIYRYSPKGEDGECLVGPTEIFPDDVERVGIVNLPDEQKDGDDEHRNADEESLDDRTLVDVERVGYDESAGTQRCVTTRDRCCHNTKDSKDATKLTKPSTTDLVDDNRCREELCDGLIRLTCEGGYGLRRTYLTPSVGKEEPAAC